MNGILPSGQIANLPTIPASFWQKDSWLASNALLAARPRVGGPNGIQPDSPNDRVMESFGSNDYPYPFMAVDKQINGPKGRVMALRAATAIPTITELANTAVRDDTQADADALLQAVRVVSCHESDVTLIKGPIELTCLSNSQGFSTFEYLNTPDASLRWNAVRQQIRLQFSYIEADLGVPNLVAWWDLFSNDYFALVGERARSWATDAINAAAAPFVQAHNAGRNLQTYEQVIGALEEMLGLIPHMQTPPDTTMQNPQPPGGGS